MRLSEELESYVNDYRSKRIEQKKQMLNTDRAELNRLYCEALDNLIGQQLDRQRHGELNKIRYVYLCRLASSEYTESYKTLLGMSDSMLYLDDRKTEVLWYPAPVYHNMKRDMDKVRDLIEERKEKAGNNELLVWKQKLLEDDWELLKEQFPELIQENFYRIIKNSLLIEDNFSALCGDYMERLPIVWETSGNQGMI